MFREWSLNKFFRTIKPYRFDTVTLQEFPGGLDSLPRLKGTILMGKKDCHSIVGSVIKENNKVGFLPRREGGERAAYINVNEFTYRSSPFRIIRVGRLRGFSD